MEKKVKRVKNPKKINGKIGRGFCENCLKRNCEIREVVVLENTFWLCKDCNKNGVKAKTISKTNWEM